MIYCVTCKRDECCKKTGDGTGDGGDAEVKPSRTRDPNSIGSILQ